MISHAIALLACVLLAQTVQSQVVTFPNYTSTNQTVKGFKILTNVTTYMTMSKDACQVRDLLLSSRPLDFEAAKFIYNNGSNSFSSNGVSKRTFVGYTRGAHATGHVYFTNGTALFGNQSLGWIGDYVVAALSGPNDDNWSRARAAMATHTLIYQIPLSYLMTEILGIAEEIDPEGTNSTSGPPHALEEGFGIYTGVQHECAAWSVAERTAPAFGTRASCDISKVNEAIIQNFNAAQAAIFAGSVTDYVTAQDNIIRNVKAALVQNVIHSANEAELASGMSQRANKTARLATKSAKQQAKNLGKAGSKGVEALRLKEAAADAEEVAMSKAEDLHVKTAVQYTAFRALGPFVYMVNETAARSMDTMLHWDAPIAAGHADKVRTALEGLYAQMEIMPEMVGTLGANSTVTCN